VGLVILDVMMPMLDGYETCRALRNASSVPILMLTALGDEGHEIRGMDGGADDYLPKPFSRDLLRARVRALFRRSGTAEPARWSGGGIVLDADARRASSAGETLELSLKEFELLRYLMANAGAVCLRERILDRVWGPCYQGDPRTLDAHVKSLRRKLGKARALIVTCKGVGYSFEADDR
jgi:DNA-binding response OmpR family regulator